MNQLNGNLDAPVLVPDAPRERRIHLQLLPDGGKRHTTALECHRRRPRDHAQCSELRQPGREFFGESCCHVGVGRIGGEVVDRPEGSGGSDLYVTTRSRR